jgi:hypothetical protein
MRSRLALLACLALSAVSAQIAGDAPDKGAVAEVGTDCDTFAALAKRFLSNSGYAVAQSNKKDEDWACGSPGYRCIVFRNAPPRTVAGKTLSRDDVVRNYLKNTPTPDLRAKNLGRGYWVAPNHNFVVGPSLQLKREGVGCSVKLFMPFGMGGTVFLVIFPFDLYTWPVPQDNGRLQSEYLAAIVAELPH